MSVQRVTDKLIDLFDHELRYRPAPAEDHFAEQGRDYLAELIGSAVRSSKPIQMLLPGFAHKNPNRRKTLGFLPDLAEKVVLLRLNNFCAQASDIYCPAGEDSGCQITIFSDGRIWGDLLGVSTRTFVDYGIALRQMLPRQTPHLRFEDFDTHLLVDKKASFIEAFENHWARQHRQPMSDQQQLLARFARLISEDRMWEPSLSESMIKQMSQSIAKRMLKRLAAFRGFLDATYTSHVRLSVHVGSGGGPNFPVRLFSNSDCCELPYHCVMVLDANGTSPRPMYYEQAVDLPGGVDVLHKDGRPWCLRQRWSYTDANYSV